jgi:hypothetical protein
MKIEMSSVKPCNDLFFILRYPKTKVLWADFVGLDK